MLDQHEFILEKRWIVTITSLKDESILAPIEAKICEDYESQRHPQLLSGFVQYKVMLHSRDLPEMCEL